MRAAVLAGLALAWAAPLRAAGGGEAPFAVLQHRVIPPSRFSPATPDGAAVVPISLVVQAGSSWATPGVLEETLGKASAIFAACGVTLGEADVSLVRWTPRALGRLSNPDPYRGPPESDAVSRSGARSRPLGFLFGPGAVPAVAKAFNQDSVDGLARMGHPDAAVLWGTFWITTDWRRLPAPEVAPSYSIAAHELAHLLGNLGHVPEAPNLMSESEAPGAQNGDLTPAQCAAIRSGAARR